MIRGLVDFALTNRVLVLAMSLMLFIGGIVSFRSLPVEAYPDVANNYVQIITQWPGRAAEEVEQQVTVPLEIVMNGIPHLTSLRSTSLFGLSAVTMVFDDDSENDWNRAKVLERLAQVTLPPGLQPQMGTDWSPVGQIYFYTLHSTNPQFDIMDLKSKQDWFVEKQFKSVPNVVDVSSLGGMTREYQVRLDPNKLISYGLSIAQVEQQLTNNNVNAGGSFIETGLQQVNVRAVGLVKTVADIERTVIATKNGTAIKVKDIATVGQGPKIRLGRNGKAIHKVNGDILDNDDVIEGIVLLRKGAEGDSTLDLIHEKVRELNGTPDHPGLLPRGVTIVPFLDRSNLVHFTTHTVLHNLRDGIILVAIILFAFLGNIRGALIVSMTIPFALLFASTCLKLKGIPANLLSLGALDFGMVVDGAVVMVENILRHLGRREGAGKPPRQQIAEAAHEVQRPVFYAIGIIITAYIPIFTLQSVEGRLFKPMAWTVAFALAGALIFSMLLAPVLASFLFPKGAKEWRNPLMTLFTRVYRFSLDKAIRFRYATVGAGILALAGALLLSQKIGVNFFRTSTKERSGSAGHSHQAPVRRKACAWRIRRGSLSPHFRRLPLPPARLAVRTMERIPPAFSTLNILSI
jgi:cobalt-zinc-cadmium resistance protein CzcA